MRKLGICGVGKPKFRITTKSLLGKHVAPNLFQGSNVSASNPNAVWVSDITYIPTSEGWLYLCTVLDVYSRKIVGWSMSNRINAKLVYDAVKAALSTRSTVPGLIFHSDRGSQYQSNKVIKTLASHGIRRSMSGKGNCYDNCAPRIVSGVGAATEDTNAV